MADGSEKKTSTNSLIRIITGQDSVNHQEILEILSIAVIVVHVLMVFLFHIMGVWQLSLYNIIVTAYYSYCYTTVREGKVRQGYILTFAEIVVQMVFTTLIIGWSVGFYAYVIALIPLYYYINMFLGRGSDHPFMPFFWSMITFGIFLGTFILSLNVTPVTNLDMSQKVTIFIFNTFFAFQLIIWMSHFLVLGYKKTLNAMAERNASLDEAAGQDPLTKLFNRRTMEERLDEALEAAKKNGTIFSLVMGDIDFFKKINDTFGHDCGDVALVAVAEILKACVRDGDIVCRWGGEEFLLLVSGNRGVATTVAERIRSRIENNVVEFGGNQIKFTMTLGVSTYAPGYSLDALVNQADENLYYGKEHGRNQVVALKPQVKSTVSGN